MAHSYTVPGFKSVSYTHLDVYKRQVRMSAICSGVDVNAKHECLTPEGEVIENLYAIGNCSGHFYGGIDYPLTVFGLSLGRCYTEGYVIGRMVAEK